MLIPNQTSRRGQLRGKVIHDGMHKVIDGGLLSEQHGIIIHGLILIRLGQDKLLSEQHGIMLFRLGQDKLTPEQHGIIHGLIRRIIIDEESIFTTVQRDARMVVRVPIGNVESANHSGSGGEQVERVDKANIHEEESSEGRPVDVGKEEDAWITDRKERPRKDGSIGMREEDDLIPTVVIAIA